MTNTTIENVVMIISDDLRPELNCFGKMKLHTPNIDSLASQSAVFEKDYVNFSQCMPSRASMLCGVRPQGFSSRSTQLLKGGELTLPALLKRTGMKTVSSGKIYHEPLDDSSSWDELYEHRFEYDENGGAKHVFHDYQNEEDQKRTAYKFTMHWSELSIR